MGVAMDLPVTVHLKRPIMEGEREIRSLLFDEPDIGTDIDYLEMLEGIDEAPPPHVGMRVSLFWIARLAGISEDAARQIKASDQKAVSDAVDAVFGAIGRSSPEQEDSAAGKPEAAAD